MFDMASIIKSFMPADFDMEKEIERFRQLVTYAQDVAQRVQRIEQKIDSEIVTLRTEVAALSQQVASLRSQEGEHNGNGSDSHGDDTCRSIDATLNGNVAGG